jgi:hypothetical protein
MDALASALFVYQSRIKLMKKPHIIGTMSCIAIAIIMVGYRSYLIVKTIAASSEKDRVISSVEDTEICVLDY